MKKQIRLFLLPILCGFFFTANAQSALDSIKASLLKTPRLFAQLDCRNSFINNELVNIFGFKAGVSYNKKLRFGIGYNQLYNSPKYFNEDVQYFNYSGKPYLISKRLKLFYLSATAEYAFYQTKHWELAMPLQIGIGQTCYQYELNGEKIKTNKKTNFIYEPTISVEYKIVKWIGVGFDFGYRFMVTDNRKLNREFNAPIVTFDILIHYSEIYKSLFPNSKLAKHL